MTKEMDIRDSRPKTAREKEKMSQEYEKGRRNCSARKQ